MQASDAGGALLRPEEVAAKLGVTEHTLAQWRSTKRYAALTYIKVGSRIRYRREVVDAFVRACEVGVAP